jgi:hypothetical protein
MEGMFGEAYKRREGRARAQIMEGRSDAKQSDNVAKGKGHRLVCSARDATHSIARGADPCRESTGFSAPVQSQLPSVVPNRSGELTCPSVLPGRRATLLPVALAGGLALTSVSVLSPPSSPFTLL